MMLRMRRRWKLIACAALALSVWVACLTILLEADWYLSCERYGAQLKGIDCLSATPRTGSEPAGSIGFWALTIGWWLATLALAGCAVAPMVARYRRGGGAAAAPR